MWWCLGWTTGKIPLTSASPRGKDAKHGRPGLLTQQKNLIIVSNKLRGNRGRDASLGYIPTPRDWNVLKMDKHTMPQIWKLKQFPHKVLKDATRNFNKKNLIGQGGSGDVYKGYLPKYSMYAATKPQERFPIAVKRIRRLGAQGHEEWLNELRYLSLISHPNVVNLIGYCSQGKHRMLVYEHMNGGSLEDHLLAEDNQSSIVMLNLPMSCLMLPSIPSSQDFGLARYGPEGDQSHVSSRILGTRGYFAPEYIATGHLSLKADVYSFGVVLLQILCGCGAVRKCSDGMKGNLAQWAKPYLSNTLELHRVIDKRQGHGFQLKEACEFAEITDCCLCSNPKKRPTMAQVVACLEKVEQKLELHNQKS
ncbi:hypothetical protein L6164_027130 [Bauhinia variegata]|uniref:Uncharacterized protein n=1 Tax=Bauhinia variegata TaxID=167791 RepID=A0ACB9LSU1_BAUVA|nr:hypothetical protein L6164_027130 [Bauhinia variegata]